ncbi:metallophosphoesterase family protein, partial [Patulibacter sp. S7RM1-6]
GGVVRAVAPTTSTLLRGARHAAATVEGLAPATTYEYRVGGPGGWTGWTRFTTAADGLDAPWRWLYNGDAQEGLDVWAPWIRSAFRDVPDARLVAHAGDLINAPNEDAEWAAFFAPQAGAIDRVTTFAVPGNHEYVGTKSTFPWVDVDADAATFRAHFEHPRTGPAGFDDTAYTFAYQGVRFVALNTGDNLTYDPTPQQAAWLDATLAADHSRWTVVMFHIPVFSSADQHHSQAGRVRDSFLEILERHDVDLVIQGHTHAYGRGHVRADGPQYVVSTSGPKYYDLGEPGADWTANGATPVRIVGQTSTYQAVCVSRDGLALRTVVTGKGPESTTDVPVGGTLDAFTIRRDGTGRKRVADGYACGDEPTVPAGDAGGASGAA